MNQKENTKEMDRLIRIMIVAVMALMIAAAPAAAADKINGAGATFPYPVYSAWAFEYNKVTGAQLNYQSIGSGGGQRQITERTVDFGASDAPLDAAQLDKDGLLQFPAVIGGVVPVVNVQGVKPGQLNLDQQTLCGIFLGTVTKWDDAKIAASNPGVKLPSTQITVVHRSDGSGTTAIFTSYLSAVCAEWKEKVGEGKAVKWPVGIGGKGNEGVANYVKRGKNTIGYVEYAYAHQNKLSHANLRNQAGSYVAPSIESFKAAAAAADFDPAKHFDLWLIDAPGKDSWPIAGATFILLAREKKEQNAKVAKFFEWAFKNGDNTAASLEYVPLPQELKQKVAAYWAKHGVK